MPQFQLVCPAPQFPLACPSPQSKCGARLKKIQALAVWRWSNFLHRHAWCSQPPLLINMDETAIRLHQTWRPGLLSTTARNMMRQPRGIVRNASRSERRTMFTLLAFVCNDEDIQEVLRRVASTSCFKYFNVMTRCFELRTHSVYSEPLQQGVLLAFFFELRGDS